MNRRRVLGLAMIAPALLPTVARAHQPGEVAATPVPISDQFTVTWWTIDDQDPDYPLFMGDVQNIADVTVDAPVVGITAFDSVGNILGSSYATPQPPVLEPGARAYLYGAAPKDIPEDAVIELSYCPDQSGSSYYTQETVTLNLVLSVDEETKGERSFHAVGTVQNNGDSPAEFVAVVAVFSNPNGRVVGALSTQLDRDVPTGKFMRWTIDHGGNTYHTNHPFTEHLDASYVVSY